MKRTGKESEIIIVGLLVIVFGAKDCEDQHAARQQNQRHHDGNDVNLSKPGFSTKNLSKRSGGGLCQCCHEQRVQQRRAPNQLIEHDLYAFSYLDECSVIRMLRQIKRKHISFY